MNSNLAFMPFWVGDYLKDTMHLSTRQHGAYLLILFSMWSNSLKDTLKETNKETDKDTEKESLRIAKAKIKHLKSICRLTDEEWEEDSEEILNFFKIDGEYIISERLTKELNSANEKYQKALDRSKKANEAKAKKQAENKNTNKDTLEVTNKDTLEESTRTPISTPPRSPNHNHNHNHNVFISKELKTNSECNLNLKEGESEKKSHTNFYIENPIQEFSETDPQRPPTIEQVKAHIEMNPTLRSIDAQMWFDFWTAQNWRDSRNMPIRWRNKLINQCRDKRFQKTQATTGKGALTSQDYEQLDKMLKNFAEA